MQYLPGRIRNYLNAIWLYLQTQEAQGLVQVIVGLANHLPYGIQFRHPNMFTSTYEPSNVMPFRLRKT